MAIPKDIPDLIHTRPYVPRGSLDGKKWFEWSEPKAITEEEALPIALRHLFADTITPFQLYEKWEEHHLRGASGKPIFRPSYPVPAFVSEWHKDEWLSKDYDLDSHPGHFPFEYRHAQDAYAPEGAVQPGKIAEITAIRDALEKEVERAGQQIEIFSRRVARVLKAWMYEVMIQMDLNDNLGRLEKLKLANDGRNLWLRFIRGHNFDSGKMDREYVRAAFAKSRRLGEFAKMQSDGYLYYVEYRDTFVSRIYHLNERLKAFERVVYSAISREKLPQSLPVSPYPETVPRTSTIERVVMAHRIAQKSDIGLVDRIGVKSDFQRLLSEFLWWKDGESKKNPLDAVFQAIGYNPGRGRGDLDHAINMLHDEVVRFEEELGDRAVQNIEHLVGNWLTSRTKNSQDGERGAKTG